MSAASNASLYALTAAVCCSMGFIPQLGFVHQAGTLPFIYDAADLYKHETSWPAAFESQGFPHTRGDDPNWFMAWIAVDELSPHTWG